MYKKKFINEGQAFNKMDQIVKQEGTKTDKFLTRQEDYQSQKEQKIKKLADFEYKDMFKPSLISKDPSEYSVERKK